MRKSYKKGLYFTIETSEGDYDHRREESHFIEDVAVGISIVLPFLHAMKTVGDVNCGLSTKERNAMLVKACCVTLGSDEYHELAENYIGHTECEWGSGYRKVDAITNVSNLLEDVTLPIQEINLDKFLGESK